MSTSAPLLRLCHFQSPFLPLQSYYCYNDEICCKEGCCNQYADYKYFHSWHFCLGVVVFVLLYRYICWYCKRAERQDNVLRLREEETLNSHVVNLMVSYNNRRNDLREFFVQDGAPKDEDNPDPPPRYNVALHLPKPPSDEVPSYEQATSMR
ncbi:uncharacterized protein LOC123008878 isoform X3 [Tribolium madens]|uniref:uncharacterized protein LOC123008878 isoform X3 n=1 Tax=Tribolium madens TaxID=41895 RepID=UPI001CF72337|nr:uncharacterized protein LOC123008878 isoform X3 [Tribolium madens]